MRVVQLLILGALAVVHVANPARAQHFAPSEADSLAERLSGHAIEDYESTLPIARALYQHYRGRADTCRMAEVSVALGSCYDAMGTLDSALFVLLRANSWTERGCAVELPFRVALNLSSVYLSLGEFQRADSICRLALEELQRGRTSAHQTDLMFNRAVALASQGDLDGADAVFGSLERVARERGLVNDEIDAMLNRGALRGMQKDYIGARSILEQALVRCKAVDCPTRNIILQNLAATLAELGQFEDALVMLDSSFSLSRAKGDLQLQVKAVGMRALYAHELGDHERVWTEQELYNTLRDSLLNVEKVHAISDVREKYQTEKRLRQIKELEVENLDAELQQARLKRTRNIYLFAGIAVIGLAGGLWSRLRYVHRSRAAIQHEKDISEGLLLNILPEEVAAELKAKGEAEAKLIDEVTVLFTDFKGFTALSEVLTPKELVKDLHECFSAFDAIMEKHGLEKIKTIGDAYMAAGGLPVPNSSHAMDAVQAALEMRDFVAAGKARKQAQGLPFFEVRIGIHSGPVVAGIVGVKKFQYDIWGDTVNTASRMESSGEPGNVNISGATYELVKEGSGLVFTPRGKVQAKGKGEMEMFFVERVFTPGGDRT
ncbi:MAG: adenylate/guanylate cyclase domain-containing protein [Flavobacteriales bacterium]